MLSSGKVVEDNYENPCSPRKQLSKWMWCRLWLTYWRTCSCKNN